jgi:hypothetical protein
LLPTQHCLDRRIVTGIGMAGRDLADIARDWGCSEKEAAVRLHPAGAIYFQMGAPARPRWTGREGC